MRERAKMRAVERNNQRGILGVKRINKMQNGMIHNLCDIVNSMDNRIMESMSR